jgi:hypothetical protein
MRRRRGDRRQCGAGRTGAVAGTTAAHLDAMSAGLRCLGAAEVRVGTVGNRPAGNHRDGRRRCGEEEAAHGTVHARRAGVDRRTVDSVVATVVNAGTERGPVTDQVVPGLVPEGRLDPVGLTNRIGEARSFEEIAAIATRCPGGPMGRRCNATAGINVVLSATALLTGVKRLICHRGHQARCRVLRLHLEATFGVPICRASVTTKKAMDASPTAQSAPAHLDGTRHPQSNNLPRPYLRALRVPRRSSCRRRPPPLRPRSNSRPRLSGLSNSSLQVEWIRRARCRLRQLLRPVRQAHPSSRRGALARWVPPSRPQRLVSST